MRIESRGVRCLECTGLDLKAFPDHAKTGFGWCALSPTPHFVSFAMSRNCMEYERAPDELVRPREAWAEKIRMFWQK